MHHLVVALLELVVYGDVLDVQVAVVRKELFVLPGLDHCFTLLVLPHGHVFDSRLLLQAVDRISPLLVVGLV